MSGWLPNLGIHPSPSQRPFRLPPSAVDPSPMTLRSALLTLPLALCCLGFPVAPDPTALTALEKTVAQQAAALAATEARLAHLEQYLAAQAVAESTFVQATQAAQKAGFVAGINPASREILVAAWGARAEARSKGLPQTSPTTKSDSRD